MERRLLEIIFRNSCKRKIHKTYIRYTIFAHPKRFCTKGSTLKKYILANIHEGIGMSKALYNALEVMRTTVHSTMKKSAFELHMGRKPQLEIQNYLNVEPRIKIHFRKTRHGTNIYIWRKWR